MFLYVEDLLEGIICSTHLWREKMLIVIRTYPCLKFEKLHSSLVNVYTRCRETFLLSLQQFLYSICPLYVIFTKMFKSRSPIDDGHGSWPSPSGESVYEAMCILQRLCEEFPWVNLLFNSYCTSGGGNCYYLTSCVKS